jgi:hypothetical protein
MARVEITQPGRAVNRPAADRMAGELGDDPQVVCTISIAEVTELTSQSRISI